MRVVGAAEIDACLDRTALIEALAEAFSGAVVQPKRHHHEIENPGAPASTLLLMPAWTGASAARRHTGVKIVTVVPGNAGRALPTVIGSYLLMDGETGAPLAILDGPALTLWRTAAASALAARFLARDDAETHLMIGTGALAPHLVRAMRTVRPIRRTLLWNRSHDRADALAERLRGEGLDARAVPDVEAALGEADIVSAATLSTDPPIRGRFLKPGTHLDLVGAFRPDMRETDGEAVARARLFVDTREGALAEGGDLVQAFAEGAASPGDIVAELSELCRGTARGRASAEEITLFKSVGAAIEDLAAAVLVYERL